MDAAVETHLESTGDAGYPRNKLPELSRSQTTLDGPLPSLKKRKSLRTRPSDALHQQHDVPPPPLKDSVSAASGRPDLRPRVSKMSLFSLFSKPKVEKLRGYAEPGLDPPPGPPRAYSNSAVPQAKPDIVVRVKNAEGEQGRVRPTSSKSYTGRGARFVPTKEPLPPLPTDRRLRPFDPPPLFQVWPQARKHGTLEVSATQETVLQKSKGRTSGGLFAAGENMSSLNIPGNRGSGATVKSAIKHVANGSISNHNLVEKVFVLTTSGFLLQYADDGPSDRLPEKILQLGKDSAAYASDLIPGRYHVLQIAQAVDQHGGIASGSHSILSRFGIRNQASKRLTTNFLLAMPGVLEMDEWMTAIRKEIEVQGGKRARSDSGSSRTTRPKTGEPLKLDLKKTPSQSHRYQVKRDPTKPANVTSPSSEALAAFPSPPIETPEAVHEVPAQSADVEVKPQGPEEVTSRPRAPSDAPSVSSTAVSVEQQQLEKLRNSVRASHSTVATSVAAASRTNSMTSTPPSDQSKDSSEGARDAVVAKVPYRSLSSYTLAKRRSAAPLSLKDAPLPEGMKVGGLVQQKLTLIEGASESPIVGYGSPLPEPVPSPERARLSALQAQSVPNLKSKVESESKHDSKMASPPMATPEDRPESFIADLPDPNTWKTSPGYKTASIPMPPLLDTTAARAMQKADPSSPSYMSPHSRPLRSNSNSFSLPLRVNPVENSPPKPTKLAASEEQEERVLSPVPAVTTLTAKVDIGSRTTIDSSYIPARMSSSSGLTPGVPTKSPKRTPSARLSLFPSATAPPPPIMLSQMDVTNLRRSPSATVLSSNAQAQANGMRLARPTSLQVRSDHAPFLSSVRNTSGPIGQQRFVATAPIRSLKPSRSVATMQTIRSTPAFTMSNPKLVEEATDQPMSLPRKMSIEHSSGPLGIERPPSRTRKLPRSRTSLPQLDFGIPLVGLGPPAPPPQAPLPDIPSGSRPQSPENAAQIMPRSGSIGVAIGETIEEKSEHQSTAPLLMGLGIRVGGAD